MSEWIEATITVNGQPLTVGQSMTVRCALEIFSLSLEDGEEIDAGHLANVQAIRGLIYRS